MIKTLFPVAALMLSACAAQPPLQASPPQAPAQWRHAQDAAPSTITGDWWRSFGSAELDALIETAQAQSVDIAASVARVHQAQAVARAAGAALLPAVAGRVDASRSEGRGGVPGPNYSAGVSASYELDFWGRNRAMRDSAQSTLRATEFDKDTVQLTVTAGVASAWLQAVGLLERLTIANANLASAQRVLDIVESRARAGAAHSLELAQQRGVVAAQSRVRAAILQQAEDSRTALAVLLGRSASALALTTTDLDAVNAPAIGPGLPADLLIRRPDIARAEAQLAAADANIAAARAAMLPSVVLSAAIDSGGNRLRSLFDNPLYSVAAGLTAPIFNAGRLAAGRDLAIAQREELLANYRGAIVAAFGDVEIALNAVNGIEAQRTAQAEELRQAQRALTLAESRYRAGAETLLTLLDAQSTLYAAQDAAVQLRMARLQASVALYRALGGGWQLEG